MKFTTLLALFATTSAVKMHHQPHDIDPTDYETLDSELEAGVDADESADYWGNHPPTDAGPFMRVDHCYKFQNRAFNRKYARISHGD